MSSCRFSLADSLVRLATECLATYIGKATYYTWDYDPLRVVISDNAQSLRGYYLHRAHLVYAQLTKKYIIKRTSKPVNKLLTASCNLLSAKEILPITVPINARRSFEIEARPSRIISSSDCASDGAGLVL